MGWEWRVFFPSESSDVLDVWSLLQPRDRPRGSPERRSDVYIKCTPGAGLKVRAGRLIEVKLRSTRDTVQGPELWKKVTKKNVCILNIISFVPCWPFEYYMYINTKVYTDK